MLPGGNRSRGWCRTFRKRATWDETWFPGRWAAAWFIWRCLVREDALREIGVWIRAAGSRGNLRRAALPHDAAREGGERGLRWPIPLNRAPQAKARTTLS